MRGKGAMSNLLWDPNISATSDVYRSFLAQYLPQLEQFMAEVGITGMLVFSRIR